jgi:cytoplasmic iron level regulating protein YaaA (DUF328/UPF0246 family)
MRQHGDADSPLYQAPQLLSKAEELGAYLKTLSTAQIQSNMKISSAMAEKTRQLLEHWTAGSTQQLPAIDAFLGDIYSGLQVQTFDQSDRAYANDHLLILSGLYGGLRALDSIMPYRLEMGYRLPDEPYKNLYSFWSDSIAALIPSDNVILNLSAVEYTKAILPHLSNPVISPKFLTRDPSSGEPKFVTVHAKIARGAFARWLIAGRIDTPEKLSSFSDLGYHFDPALSTPDIPVFICDEFKGIGLSVRLTPAN